ncbi:MAG: class I SAM-dependent methyltransferase [Phycisphaerae bacterium]|jgi:ubiquinone/menaquinone biosynthesis C-methylase UbiE
MPRHRRNANQRYHDRVAARYEHIYDDAYWQWHDAITWEHLKRFLPAEQGRPVADLGCGSGKWGRRLLKSGYRVTFVDFSARMVDEARRQVADSADAGRAEFLQADLVDLSALPAAHFGLAVAMGEPIGLCSDPARALREIARVLIPGGTLVATFDQRIACIDHYVQQGDVEALERFLRTGLTHWLTRDPGERFEIHTFEPDQLRRMLSAAGFEVLDVIGKTVLPMRAHRDRLEDPGQRRKWVLIEQRLHRDPANLARCGHLQVAARRTGGVDRPGSG